MSVDLILNLLKELNKSILFESLSSIILFYSTSSINLVMNLHEFHTHKRTLNYKKDHFSP